MEGFVGTFAYTVDLKGRLTIPSKFKNELGETFITRVHTQGKYVCIGLYNDEGFKNAYEESLREARNSVEKKRKTFAFYAGANEVSPDAKGRILVPLMTLQKAGITNECVMVGMYDHVEVWNPERFNAYCNEVEEDGILEETSYASESRIEAERRANGDFLGGGHSEG